MTLFALLHGGMHHGSSWNLVTSELQARGHTVVAPDLPVDDEGAGAEEWARVVIESIDAVTSPADEDVVVVGHSVAGLCTPVVAARRAVRRMVFVAGLIPVPGRSFVDHLVENPGAVTFPATTAAHGGPFGLTFESLREGFYNDCPETLARQAFEQLRGQAFTVFTERSPIDDWPDVPATSVVMTDDRAVSPAWSRRMARRLPRTNVIEMAGGHSPFFARPGQLCDVLIASVRSEVRHRDP